MMCCVQTKTPGARLNATMCPHNPDLIAFVNTGDIWVSHLASRGRPCQAVRAAVRSVEKGWPGLPTT